MVVRAIINRPGAKGTDRVSALPGVDWNRIRESDAKYAKALTDLVPPKLRAPSHPPGNKASDYPLRRVRGGSLSISQ